MVKPKRHPEIVWRVEKRKEARANEALASGENAEELGTVILINAGMMHQLNLVGGMIWQLCDGSRNEAQIVAQLAAEFEVDSDELAADVQAFLADLVERGWLIDDL